MAIRLITSSSMHLYPNLIWTYNYRNNQWQSGSLHPHPCIYTLTLYGHTIYRTNQWQSGSLHPHPILIHTPTLYGHTIFRTNQWQSGSLHPHPCIYTPTLYGHTITGLTSGNQAHYILIHAFIPQHYMDIQYTGPTNGNQAH